MVVDFVPKNFHLFGQIVNGLVLASDGQKMSKSKKNYPDPLLVVNQHGADALRLYLINSPGKKEIEKGRERKSTVSV